MDLACDLTSINDQNKKISSPEQKQENITMAAIIRLKRRVDEDPLDAFVLNCKRQRTDSVDPQQSTGAGAADLTSETSTVLKFAGTFSEPNNIPTHIQQRLSKDEAKEAISREHRPKIAIRNRAALRQNAQNSRFRIVNCTRSLSQVDGAEGATIVDVERDIASTAAEPAIAAASNSEDKRPEAVEQDYVYDLYVVDEAQQQQQRHVPYIPDNLDDISVAIFDYPLFSSHRPLGDRSDDSLEESEDSNDENNWRNDYPDEDEDEYNDDRQSIDEYDMREAVEDLELGEDLSSDDDDADVAYRPRTGGIRGLRFSTIGDDVVSDHWVSAKDVKLFGMAYARYKARVINRPTKKKHESDSEIEDSDDRSATDDSEDDYDLYD